MCIIPGLKSQASDFQPSSLSLSDDISRAGHYYSLCIKALRGLLVVVARLDL